MKKPLYTILNYSEEFTASFIDEPFNEVDSAIFGWLSFMTFKEEFANSFSDEGMPLAQLVENNDVKDITKGIYWPEEAQRLLHNAINNPRYEGAVIKYYRLESDLEIALQFAAFVLSFKNNVNYVVFRGTDKTIHGWKENIKVLMSRAAPAQMMAVGYLNGVARRLEGDIYVGGHSKGANLAIYAAAHCDCDVQDRIVRAFSNDGPGFIKEELECDGMKAIRDRITKVIPTSSVVGVLLHNETEPKYIHSNLKGPIQHYPGSWEVEYNTFKAIPARKVLSDKLVRNVNKWAETASDEELEMLMDVMFGIAEAGGEDDLNRVLANPVKHLYIFAQSFVRTDAATKNTMFHLLMNAVGGRTDTISRDEEYDLDWKNIECIMNDYEQKVFNERYNLFL